MTRDMFAGMRMGTLLTTSGDVVSDAAAALVGEGTVADNRASAALCGCRPNSVCPKCAARL